MSDAWKKYVDDPRTICRYGVNCYQKNAQHLAAYKHPPTSKRRTPITLLGSKRAKIQPFSPKSDDLCSDNQLDISHRNDHVEHRTSPVLGESSENLPTASKVDSLDEQNSKENEKQITPQELNPVSHIAKEIIFLDANLDSSKMIKELFLVDMPNDFYNFWKFISEENENGTDILKAANLELIGPFDVLRGKLPRVADTEQYLVHWRFFYDPPEFQAVIKCKGESEFHIGYYRDTPSENPAFVGSNDSSKNCTIAPLAGNIFGAVYIHLQAERKKSPFTTMSHHKVLEKVKVYAEKINLPLEKFDNRRRLASVAVTRTFHGAGVVVPYNKSSQLGYRPLVESDASIKKILSELSSAKSNEERNKLLSSLQPIITYASIAMDEGDFGTGLELGIDLFCSGLLDLNAAILSALTTAYSLLNRNEFTKIIQLAMELVVLKPAIQEVADFIPALDKCPDTHFLQVFKT